MTGINFKGSDGNGIFSLSVQNRNQDNKLTERVGTIISALVLNKTENKMTLRTKEDLTFDVDAAKVNGEVGEELYFQVMGSGKNGLSLKQIDNPFLKTIKESQRPQSAANIKELFERSNFIKEENVLKNDDQDQQDLEEAQMLAKIKRDLAFGYNNVNRNAVAELLKQGISLDEMDLGMLTQAIKEIKTAHPPKNTENSMPDADINFSGRKPDRDRLEKYLAANDLPVTDDNIKSLESVTDKYAEIRPIDDAAIKKLIRDDKEEGGFMLSKRSVSTGNADQLTLRNVYVAKFSATESGQTPAPLEQEDMRRLMDEAKKIFRREGVEVNKETLATAEYLLKNGLPVTKENVEKVIFLKNMDKKVDLDDLLSRAVDNIKSGRHVWDLSLTGPSKPTPNDVRALMSKYDEMIKFIPSIGLDTVELLIKKQMPVTLNNLRAQWQPGDDASAKNNNYSATGQETSVTTVTARRQIHEIQLRLTSEAAYRLAGKNIDINILPVKEALESIKIVENEMYAGNLRIMGGEASEKNISQMSDLFRKLSEITPLTDNAYGGIIVSRTSLSITSVHKAAVFARQAAGYEIFETVPSIRYGDSYSQVRHQMGPLLDELGINSTEENIRAGIILSKNSIDITEDHIEAVKEIDGKISNILNRLHPNIAAAMIRDGLNPAEMPLEDCLAYIDRFRDEYGENLRDKLPQLIAELDAGKTLSEQERESVIAIYRMLNTIEQNGGAGMGTAYLSESDSTLGKIFEAAKYYSRTQGKRTDRDIHVNDDFGSLEGLKGDETNVLAILRRAIVGRQSEERYTEAALNRLKDVFKTPAETMEYMLRNEIPTTPANIQATRQMLNDKFFIGRSLNRLEEELKEDLKEGLDPEADQRLESPEDESLDTDLSQLKEGISPEDILSRLSEKLERLWDSGSSANVLDQIRLVQNAVKVQNYVHRGNNNEIRMPIRLHGEISQLNMFIANESLSVDGGLSVHMALDTRVFGEISADLGIWRDHVDIELNAEDNPRAQSLKDGLAELSGSLRGGQGTKMQVLASVVSDVLKYIDEAGERL